MSNRRAPIAASQSQHGFSVDHFLWSRIGIEPVEPEQVNRVKLKKNFVK